MLLLESESSLVGKKLYRFPGEPGRLTFSAAEAMKALGVSALAARVALIRQREHGRIAMPYRGFYVIVPPEYRRLGCLPPEQFIPQLMEHLKTPYYVGLLSAAQFHGAAHQRPQELQVLVPKNRRTIVCGNIRVAFIARKSIGSVPTATVRTPRGDLRISSPEATALDLVGYPAHTGGLDGAATAVLELRSLLDPQKLREVAETAPIPWAQRLGYLLELDGEASPTVQLAEYVRANAVRYVQLAAGNDIEAAERSARWRLVLNSKVEPDV